MINLLPVMLFLPALSNTAQTAVAVLVTPADESGKANWAQHKANQVNYNNLIQVKPIVNGV